MVFNIRLLEGAKPVAGKHLKWKRSGDDAKSESGDAVSTETQPLSLTTALDKPGFVRIEVWVLDEKGQPLLDDKKKPIRFDGGAGVKPEKLDSIPEPADFDSYWNAQKAILAQIPLKSTLTEVPLKQTGFVVYDVQVDCAGGMPVRGYLTKPKGSQPKSLKSKIMGLRAFEWVIFRVFEHSSELKRAEGRASSPSSRPSAVGGSFGLLSGFIRFSI